MVIPKYLISVSQGIFLSPNMRGGWGDSNPPPTRIALDLSTFSFISIKSNSSRQTSNNLSISCTDIASNSRSSAYIIELRQTLFMKHPQSVFSNLDKISSIKIEKRIGLNIPPCLVPERTANVLEKKNPHRTFEALLFNHPSYKLIRVRGIFFFIILMNRASLFILSNAFSISREQTITVE